MVVRIDRLRLVGHGRVGGEDLRQRDVLVRRVHEQVQRQLGLEPLRQQEVDQLSGLGGVLRAAEDAGVLDLAEARRGDDAGRRGVDRRVGEHDLRRRARAVADHERPVAVTGAGERAVVGVLPRVDDLDPVGAQARPVVGPAVLAVLGDRRQQERQPGRRRGRVLDHEQVGVRRVRQRLEVGRRLESLLLEPRLVVVDAHVAEVDRRRLAVRRQLAELGRDGVEPGGRVRLEHALVDDP